MLSEGGEEGILPQRAAGYSRGRHDTDTDTDTDHLFRNLHAMDAMASTSYTYNNNTIKHSSYSHARILIVKKARILIVKKAKKG